MRFPTMLYVQATSKGSDQPVHTRSLIRAFASRWDGLSVKLLTEHHLEFLNLKEGFTGSSESTLVKFHIVENHRRHCVMSLSNTH